MNHGRQVAVVVVTVETGVATAAEAVNAADVNRTRFIKFRKSGRFGGRFLFLHGCFPT